MKKLFIFCLLYVHMLISDEYVYPVANLDDTMIIMMHQKSIDDLELFVLNTEKNTTQKLLSALYLPAYITFLPNKKAYSFIDRGRIHIKEIAKRMPRALDIYQPICDIQSVQWINNHQVIFSARFKNHYKIFMYDIHDNKNQLYSLCSLTDEINYIFPSAIDEESLFCLVQQDSAELYQMSKMKINPIVWDIAVEETVQDATVQTIDLNYTKPLCFLKMMNHQSGYVIELAQHDTKKKLFTFTVHKVSIPESKLESLFEFHIPEQFIIGMSKERFYESLYPLLPHYQEDKIYFTSFDINSDKLKLYLYDQETKTVSMYSTSKRLSDKNIFAPFLVHEKLYFGQST